MASLEIIAEMLEKSLLLPEEETLISLPISQLSPEQCVYAFSISDKVSNYVAEINKNFVPTVKSKFYVNSDYINGDATGSVQSMADGRIYDSKSKYYKSLKENGMVIVGDEKPKPPKPKEVNWEKALVEAKQRLGV